MRILILSIAIAAALGTLALWSLGRGAFGQIDSDTLSPVKAPRTAESVGDATENQRAAARSVGAERNSRQILFGDLHAHTTISFDAFMLNMPLLGGAGSAPPADA